MKRKKERTQMIEKQNTIFFYVLLHLGNFTKYGLHPFHSYRPSFLFLQIFTIIGFEIFHTTYLKLVFLVTLCNVNVELAKGVSDLDQITYTEEVGWGFSQVQIWKERKKDRKIETIYSSSGEWSYTYVLQKEYID